MGGKLILRKIYHVSEIVGYGIRGLTLPATCLSFSSNFGSIIVVQISFYKRFQKCVMITQARRKQF